MSKIKKGFFPFLIAITALSVSASAAFYSVTGLSKLFAGATTEVIIMAGSLELAKLVIASLLYQYWDTLNKVLRTYLTIACVVLVLITSMGIYGFLSAAYQETFSKLAVVENERVFLEKKAEFYEKDLERYDNELETILDNINVLSGAKSRSIQVRDTSTATGFRNTISTSELRLAQKRIEAEDVNKKEVQILRQKTADSLQKYKLEILQLENSFDQAGELGPLKYLSGLTGISMDRVINILLLVIIFVFDPLAISLVVAANFAFNKNLKSDEDGDDEEEDEWDEEQLYDDFLDSEEKVEEVKEGIKEEVKEEVKEEIKQPLEKTSKTQYEEQTYEDRAKVINTTNREAEVLYPDGKKRWIKKKDLDENKIKYM